MNTYRHNAARIAVTLCIGALLLTGVAMAQDAPATLPETGASATANARQTTTSRSWMNCEGSVNSERAHERRRRRPYRLRVLESTFST